LIEAGVRPSNTDQGYILRRLMRRAIRQAPGHDLGSDDPVIRDEQRAFAGTLKRGLRELERLEHPTGRDLFRLFETHGFPPELAGVSGWEEDFRRAADEHRERSRAGAERRFG